MAILDGMSISTHIWVLLQELGFGFFGDPFLRLLFSFASTHIWHISYYSTR